MSSQLFFLLRWVPGEGGLAFSKFHGVPDWRALPGEWEWLSLCLPLGLLLPTLISQFLNRYDLQSIVLKDSEIGMW